MAAFSDSFIGGSAVENSFESLDYIYTPAPDFDAAVRFYTSTLAGELRWRIHDGDVRVAAVRLAGVGPAVLLASHLASHHTILIYRVHDIAVVRRRLVSDGWTDIGEPFEIPQGPCLVFRDPGGQRLAIYERVRPGVDERFDGRIDS
jgi:predicted enzyme related to lactoylglutathione lyase